MEYEQLTFIDGLADGKTDSASIDNEFLLQDRLQKIRQIIGKYGEENFYISFSGGKDSTVLHYLIDMALPGNKIPRVYADTGIELNMIRDFVLNLAKSDSRIEIIKPKTPIKQMLEKEGYPFKSKQHAKWVDIYQRNGLTQSIENYTSSDMRNKDLYRTCPKKLKYQFCNSFKIRISDKCCKNLKEEPLDLWRKEHHKIYTINGIMREEGGRRMKAQCLAFRANKLSAFQPLAPLTKEFENWFINAYGIEICDIYKPPYNAIRTGCKGCPFALYLQDELDYLEEFFLAERKQCEYIWKPVYDEYRRIGYRLKPIEDQQIPGQISMFGVDEPVDG